MKKIEKTLFVENLTESLKSASLVVLIDYTGLSVKKQQELKKRLKSVGASMIVVKNTLFKIAGKNAKLEDNVISDNVLTGPVALITSSEDPLSPLQVLHKFAKEFEILNFKVGIVDGSFFDKEQLEKLAQLPSKEILYSQVIGKIASPLYAITQLLNANMQKLVSILDQASKIK